MYNFSKTEYFREILYIELSVFNTCPFLKLHFNGKNNQTINLMQCWITEKSKK